MPINLANVNISLQQFQKISSGTYNAGEVKLASENKLAKINNHVDRTSQPPGARGRGGAPRGIRQQVSAERST